MKNPILFVLTVLILFYALSCKKEGKNNALTKTKIRQDVSVNINNPMDYLGHLHNSYLDAGVAVSNISEQTSNFGYNFTQKFIHDSLGGDTPNVTQAFWSNNYQSYIADHSDNSNKSSFLSYGVVNFFQHIVDSIPMDSGSKSYVLMLRTELDNNCNTGYNVSNCVSNLISIENSIQADNNLTSNDKTGLLCAFAIARNSLVYWDGVSTNSSHPAYNAYVYDIGSPQPIFFLWIGVAIAATDAGVFLTGYYSTSGSSEDKLRVGASAGFGASLILGLGLRWFH